MRSRKNARSRRARTAASPRRRRSDRHRTGSGSPVRLPGEILGRPLEDLPLGGELSGLDLEPTHPRSEPGQLLIVNLGAPFRIRAGTDIETAEYADGCVVTMPTRALEFGYPLRTRSVGVHFKPWGLSLFLPMPAAELCVAGR